MPDEQAQNGAPDAPQAPTGDVENGAVNDTTPASAPSEPLPSTSTDTPAPSEPAQPVSEGTAQTADNEPLDIPPFDNSPTPTPAPAPQARTDSTSSPQGGRDMLVKARASIQQRKAKKLEKILSLFSTKQSITNDEVEKLLHVSDATATRYLSELERQGKIQQLGKTGHAVSYTKI